MSSQVLVSLLETIVLLDVMEVITSQNDGSFHLAGGNYTLEDSSSDRDIGGEGALLVNILSLNSFCGGLET